ncbi:hypothetical protein A3J19_00705 [Candidatus Daviesbacteria bacterium RIFCSPLOWO2_02_FULL_41_8]|uniref:Uncharacterized protein n=2 Tax=Candidatus Daviesiibacteriota TaxID=1752718 RepID=A0A1F5NI09_9BACT|nr:MAG: hypothetical protein A3D83_03480 [Candidatus Daviesbacteria bacterium RIFCSPHIGHO2_02_FULL_41_10]OGE77258.1 MAG: hypothetical protein A3J19_00705 [Candidatus Daviesbacteria bacterium RIFCSPLOWO2_02_FULL_41_8]
MGSKAEHSIYRSPQLTKAFTDIRLGHGLSVRTLANQVHVGVSTVDRILNPNDRKGVSWDTFSRVVLGLTNNEEERDLLRNLAESSPVFNNYISPFAQRVDRAVEKLGLSQTSRALLQSLILRQISMIGGALQEVESTSRAHPQEDQRFQDASNLPTRFPISRVKRSGSSAP